MHETKRFLKYLELSDFSEIESAFISETMIDFLDFIEIESDFKNYNPDSDFLINRYFIKLETIENYVREKI